MTLDKKGHIKYNMTTKNKGHNMKYDIISNMKTHTVNKHYQLINSRYKLSPVEQKLVLSIISLIQPNDDDFMNYQIPVSAFEFLSEARNTPRLKKYCKDLMSKPLEIEDEEGNWKLFNWFAHIEYIKKSHMLECSISPKLKPYLLQLKSHFKSYKLKYILPLESYYSIRIYEMLKKHYKMGYMIIDVEELQDLLQVPKSMKNYADFKRKVLKPTSLEIAKYCDVWYEFEEIKVGKKVVSLKIYIHDNPQNKVDDENNEFKNFINHIKEEYEGFNILYHPKLERHLCIKNGLLTIAETDNIVQKDRALELWNFIFKNKNILLAKPMI